MTDQKITEQEYLRNRYSPSGKRGCPTCDGVDPKSCLRCRGKTRLCDWMNTENGWATVTRVTK